MRDLIERKAVLALAKDVTLQNGAKHRCIDATQIYEIPSAQPDRYTIDCILYSLYNQLSNRCGTGAMVGCKDLIERLYGEIFGEGERPKWMT